MTDAEKDFSRLEQQIEKTTQAIEKLESRIQRLKEEINSSNRGVVKWDDDSIKRMNAELDKLIAKRDAAMAKRSTLESKRAGTFDYDAQRLDSLLKAINTLEERISAAKGMARIFKSDDSQYSKLMSQIAGAERALKLLDAQVYKNFGPSGKRQSALPQLPFSWGLTDPERRLRLAALGYDKTEEEVRQYAKEVLQRWKEYSSSWSTSDIPATARVSVRDIEPIDPRIAYQNEDELYKRKFPFLLKELAAEEKQASVAEERSRSEEEEWGRWRSRRSKAERDRERQAKAEEEARKAAEQRAKFEKDALANPKYRMAILGAKEAGFDISNLAQIYNRGSSIDRLHWSRLDESGVRRDLVQFVSPTGNVTPGITGQYRTFTQGVIRDIGELTKWSIAMAAIYGPIQKLGEMVSSMVENETKLADVLIITNSSIEHQGKAFDIAYEAAKRSGEEVTGVIDAYGQAYRAAGQYSGQLERQYKAEELLKASLTLSKLSTLDQTSAIDTLTAAMLQSNMELDQGATLLNKWIRVSQIAAVDITTLATGVAVLGDSAENAGLDVDHLNALMAVLAKSSIAGSKEIANTAKALIGSYQSAEAERVLARYGISLRNTKGEVREFLDIYSQLSEMEASGMLSESAMSEIGKAMGGGGSRRMKDVGNVVKSMEELKRIAEESAKETANDTLAQEALAKRLDTVQTATTRLSNAFESLAMTLGTEGGILDLMQSLANAASTVVEGIDRLFSSLGKSGPVLAAFTAAAIPLLTKGAASKEAAIYSLAEAAAMRAGRSYRPLGGAFSKLDEWNQYVKMENARDRATKFYSALYNPNLMVGGIYGAVSIGASAWQNFSSNNPEAGAGNIIGGLIGAGIGSLAAPGIGTAIGATIGSSIGEAFVRTTLTYEKDLAGMFRKAALDGMSEGFTKGEEKTPEQKLLEDIYAPEKSTGIGFLDKYGSYFGTWVATAFMNFSPLALAAKGGEGGAFWRGKDLWTVNQMALYGASPEEKARYEALMNYNKIMKGDYWAGGGISKDFKSKEQVDATIAKLSLDAEIARREQLGRVTSGKISASEFKQISENLSGYAATSVQWMDAFGESFIKLSSDINDTTDAYKAFLDITIYGSKEQREYLNALIQDQKALMDLYENWDFISKNGEVTATVLGEQKTFTSREEVAKAASDVNTVAAAMAVEAYKSAILSKYKVPSIVGDVTSPISRKDFDVTVKEGIRMQEEFLRSVGYTSDMIREFAENTEEFVVRVKEGGKEFYETVSGLSQEWYNTAYKSNVEGGIISAGRSPGIMSLDITKAQYDQIIGTQYEPLKRQLEDLGYKPQETDEIIKFADAGFHADRKDFKLVQLLLEKILDVNRKELDGIYNLPENANIYVPLEAALLRPEAPIGGGTEPWTGVIPGAEMVQKSVDVYKSMIGEYEKVIRPAGGKRGYGTELVPRSNFDMEKDVLFGSSIKGGESFNALNPEARYLGYGMRNDLQRAEGPTSLMDSIREWLSSIFGSGGVHGGINSLGELQQTVPEVSNKLDITIDSHTQLVVDGRVLADIVKTYLAAELLKSQQSQSTITRRYVI